MDETEGLFWKIYRNKFLNVQIWKVLKFRECMTYKYKEIHSVKWMLKRGYKMLLLDKVMNKKYLTFSENDVKEILQDQLYKNNEEFFKILKNHYKIHQLLDTTSTSTSTTTTKELNQFEQFDIIKLSILCGNITSLKVFYGNGTDGSGINGNCSKSVDGTSYLDVALERNDFEILKFVYNEIGEKCYSKNTIYMNLFTKPNELVIQFALDVMGIKFSARQIPLWIFFKIDFKIVKRLILGDDGVDNGNVNENIVTQISEPISSFSKFFYDVFQGTVSDLVKHCSILLFIQEVYRKDLKIDEISKQELNKLSQLIGNGSMNGMEENDQTKLHFIDNSNPVIELLNLYMNLIFKLCWRSDFKDQHYKVLIEYAVRFNDIKILESINQNKKQTNEILNKSTEYCNKSVFDYFIGNGGKNQIKFEANNRLFYKKLNDGTVNGINEIKLFINDCFIGNHNQIGKINLFKVLVQLDNIELLEYVFEKLFGKSTGGGISSTTILSNVQSVKMLQTLLSSKYKNWYSIENWDIEPLLKRKDSSLPIIFDFINVLDKFKLLDKLKSNESYVDKLILNGYYKCDIVEYLILNGFKISNDLLTNLASEASNTNKQQQQQQQQQQQLEKKKFKLILDLSDEHPELNIVTGYGNGFKSMMVYTSSLSIISFINDYRWFDIKNGRYKFRSDFIDQTTIISSEEMFEFLLTSGKYKLLIHYLTVIKQNENMSQFYFKIGESGILEIIKLYFNFINQPLKPVIEQQQQQPQEDFEDEEPQPLPTPINCLQSILAGSIKHGHLETIKLFEKYQPQLFEKDNWVTFRESYNPFPVNGIYKYKILESYIQKLLSK